MQAEHTFTHIQNHVYKSRTPFYKYLYHKHIFIYCAHMNKFSHAYTTNTHVHNDIHIYTGAYIAHIHTYILSKLHMYTYTTNNCTHGHIYA